MPILSFLGSIVTWFSTSFLTRWAATKIIAISLLTIVLPWVLKDSIQWFWKVGESYRSTITEYVNQIIANNLGGIAYNTTISLTSVGGYIANQIGLADYASILISGWSICWMIKILSRFL